MLHLNSEQLVALGAPQDATIQQIEDWLRGLLCTGTVSVGGRLIELRGGERVITTLADLKRACGVAGETVKQGLRALQLEHWIVPVEGEHTTLAGPPRFQVAMTKKNFAGSSTQAIELSVTPGLNPLDSIDYDQLSQPGAVEVRKRIDVLEKVSVQWKAEIRLPDGSQRTPAAGDPFTLAANSDLRLTDGRAASTTRDAAMKFVSGRRATLADEARLIAGKSQTNHAAGTEVLLEGQSLVRLPGGQTGILAITPRVATGNGEEIDWGDDSHWLARCDDRTPFVLVRRMLYASLRDVLGDEGDEWKVAIGVHDAMLDGSIPHQAGKCSAAKSPERLATFLRGLGETDSLRAAIEEEYGWVVDNADVRVSPVRQASNYDRKLLRAAGENPAVNSEFLCLSGRLRCWVQAGAYFYGRAALPWEITREVYFPYVDLHIVQGTSNR